MCGIAGYKNLSQSLFNPPKDILERMQKRMEHRGPDGSGVWISHHKQCGLAHRRLSIIDLSSAGAQPMMDPQQTVVVSFNGEIYNHAIIRKELESKGYIYRSGTDTETVIYAYKEWGIECIHKFEGMFAIALYDVVRDELFLIRDRIGIKPLYFSVQGGVFSFASEIKALWECPWITRKISRPGLYHYLTYLVTPAPYTLYEGIYKLPPGFYCMVDARGVYSFHEWYNPIVSVPTYTQRELNDEHFLVDHIRYLLRESIKKRMMSDVPFGVFLSGGIDSSLNVALMSEFTDRVKTFNVSFSDGPEFSEVEWARKVATEFGTDHHEVVINEKDAFDFFEKMVYHQDEPLADCVCIPLYFVSKLLKDSGVTVVQVGEGSDELFCGYSHYAKVIDVHHKFWKPSVKLVPQWAKQCMYYGACAAFPTKKNHLAKLKDWVDGRQLFWSGATAFSEILKSDFWNHDQVVEHDYVVAQIYPELRQELDSYSLVDYHVMDLKRRDPDADFLKSMIYLEFKQRLSELLLMRVDKMTMATSVESRVPFLDHTFVEFALQIPSSMKYHSGMTKYILKKACEGILPYDVIYRKKMGFAAPTQRWFQQGDYFKDYFKKLVDAREVPIGTYLKPQSIRRMYNRNMRPNWEHSLELWTLQNVLANDAFHE
ncbi:asparagine synthase (glutamine-hydrolyzing) [Candidatus Babeliales bacterium]|nr:asparagine synthase (glutamine-hydrolyzing) [Candidatus Babeliales bacterium]